MSTTTQASSASTKVDIAYTAEHVERGVAIFERLPTAKTDRDKNRQADVAATRILNCHPNHPELNALLSEIGGTTRAGRLAAAEAIFREFVDIGSVS